MLRRVRQVLHSWMQEDAQEEIDHTARQDQNGNESGHARETCGKKRQADDLQRHERQMSRAERITFADHGQAEQH